MKISFVGAGQMASSLGNLLNESGYEVKYGVRNPDKKQVSIPQACEYGEIVFIAIPFLVVENVLIKHEEILVDKIVVDLTNTINEDWSPLFLGEDSGGERMARLLPESRVVKAFNAVFADAIKPNGLFYKVPRLSVFIASDDQNAADSIRTLAKDIGFDGITVGGIRNARQLEAMAHLNISIALSGGGTNAGFTYHQLNDE